MQDKDLGDNLVGSLKLPVTLVMKQTYRQMWQETQLRLVEDRMT